MFRRLLPACSICLILSLQSFTLAEDASFKGVFKGEGKEAKLTSLTLKKGKDDRKDRLILTFSEKKQTDKIRSRRAARKSRSKARASK